MTPEELEQLEQKIKEGKATQEEQLQLIEQVNAQIEELSAFVATLPKKQD
jgi:hypothetical protein